MFLRYSPLHKGVKCLDVSTDRVYISRDVVIDENIFPFSALHPNAGDRLKKEILLLPSFTSHHGDAQNIDDHILPNVPVTNVLQDSEALEENHAENGG